MFSINFPHEISYVSYGNICSPFPLHLCDLIIVNTLSVSEAAIFRIVLSQTFKILIKFIEENAKIYITKLISLDLS